MTKLVLVYNLNRDWGVSDQWFAICDSALLTVLGQVAFMPTLVLGASAGSGVGGQRHVAL